VHDSQGVDDGQPEGVLEIEVNEWRA